MEDERLEARKTFARKKQKSFFQEKFVSIIESLFIARLTFVFFFFHCLAKYEKVVSREVKKECVLQAIPFPGIDTRYLKINIMAIKNIFTSRYFDIVLVSMF